MFQAVLAEHSHVRAMSDWVDCTRYVKMITLFLEIKHQLHCCRPRVPPASPVVFDVQLLYIPGQLEIQCPFPHLLKCLSMRYLPGDLASKASCCLCISCNHATTMHLGNMASLVTARECSAEAPLFFLACPLSQKWCLQVLTLMRSEQESVSLCSELLWWIMSGKTCSLQSFQLHGGGNPKTGQAGGLP